MDDELLKTITQVTENSVKKQIISQCAATIYPITLDIDKSVSIALEIVNKVYETV